MSTGAGVLKFRLRLLLYFALYVACLFAVYITSGTPFVVFPAVAAGMAVAELWEVAERGP